MIVIGVGRLDDDEADDLVLGELPTGMFGDETTEPSILLGRASWPGTANLEALAPKRIELPTLGDDDSFEILGLGDLNGDGRDDIVSLHVRRTSTRVLRTRVGIHFSPESWPGRPSFVRPSVTIEPDELSLYRRAVVADVTGDGAGDGAGDLLLERDGGDIAMVDGRPSWPAAFDLLTESEVVVGTGEARYGAFMPGDVDGMPGSDFAMIDRGSRSLHVYHGGEDLADRLSASGGHDWSIEGISLSLRIDALDLNGDGVNELVVDGSKIFVGGAARSGVFDVAADDHPRSGRTCPRAPSGRPT